MFADFFIKRPVFSTVTSLFIVIGGAVCIPLLPVAQFPELAPPTIAVSSFYIGSECAGGRVVGNDHSGGVNQRRRRHALHDFHQRQRRFEQHIRGV